MSLPSDIPSSSSPQMKQGSENNKRLHFTASPNNKLQENIFKKPKKMVTPSTVNKPVIRIDFNMLHVNEQTLTSMIENIHEIARVVLFSDDPDSQLEATSWFCHILAKSSLQVFDRVIQTGVVPQFVKFLTRDDKPELQAMAAWALTNLTSGTCEHVRVVIENDAVPPLVKLLEYGSNDMKEEVLWVLGNIAADSTKTRDHVLSHGALSLILSVLWHPIATKISLLQIASSTLLNLCHGKPPPHPKYFKQIQVAMFVLVELLKMSDAEILHNTLWTLTFLTQGGSNEMNQAIIVEADMCPKLIGFLQPMSESVMPVLLILGDIAAVDEAHTKILINNGVLDRLKLLLQHKESDDNILKKTCWLIANIMSANRAHIQAVIEAGLIDLIVRLMKEARVEVRKEAAWAIGNATIGSIDHIRSLVSRGCIEALCDLLTCRDPTTVTQCLKGLENILFEGKNFKKRIAKCGGLDKIINLRQSSHNSDIYEKACEILKTYWKGL